MVAMQRGVRKTEAILVSLSHIRDSSILGSGLQSVPEMWTEIPEMVRMALRLLRVALQVCSLFLHIRKVLG
jgi:hypothetical protein